MDFCTLKRWMYLTVIVSAVLSGGGALAQSPLSVARDPGVRGGAAGAGAPLAGLTARQFEFFADGKADFESVEDVPDGVGPRMNLDGCAGCHSQPAIGGTSPAVNPQVAFASKDGGTDRVPFFITLNGPVREARFKFNPDGSRDGGVHNTATITGRTGADGCVLAQPEDRKSTRLNASHQIISYAVFCLKKKKFTAIRLP